jgi:hypothetical protein
MSQLAIEAAEKRLFANRRTTFTIEKITKIKMNTTNGSLKGQIGLEKNKAPCCPAVLKMNSMSTKKPFNYLLRAFIYNSFID